MKVYSFSFHTFYWAALCGLLLSSGVCLAAVPGESTPSLPRQALLEDHKKSPLGKVPLFKNRHKKIAAFALRKALGSNGKSLSVAGFVLGILAIGLAPVALGLAWSYSVVYFWLFWLFPLFGLACSIKGFLETKRGWGRRWVRVLAILGIIFNGIFVGAAALLGLFLLMGLLL